VSIVREDLTKQLLANAGIRVPDGERATSPQSAVDVAQRLGQYPLYMKALVPMGKKNRVGGVRRINSREDVLTAATDMLARDFGGIRSDGILVERAIEGELELFVSFTFSSRQRSAVLMLSISGGVDIESAAADDPSAMRILNLDVRTDLDEYGVVSSALSLGLSDRLAARVAEAVSALWTTFRTMDLVTLEINPMLVTEGTQLTAVGVLADTDDEAFYRQPATLAAIGRPAGRYGGRTRTPLEERVRALSEVDPTGSAMLVEIPDGELAWLFAGGGCSLYAGDVCESLGGRPRTYFDATTLSKDTLREIIVAILTLPGLRGLGIGCNIRSMVRVDEEMEAIVAALKSSGRDPAQFPVVVRLAGPGEDRARLLAQQMPGIVHFGRHDTIDEAIAYLVEKQAPPTSR